MIIVRYFKCKHSFSNKRVPVIPITEICTNILHHRASTKSMVFTTIKFACNFFMGKFCNHLHKEMQPPKCACVLPLYPKVNMKSHKSKTLLCQCILWSCMPMELMTISACICNTTTSWLKTHTRDSRLIWMFSAVLSMAFPKDKISITLLKLEEGNLHILWYKTLLSSVFIGLQKSNQLMFSLLNAKENDT